VDNKILEGFLSFSVVWSVADESNLCIISQYYAVSV